MATLLFFNFYINLICKTLERPFFVYATWPTEKGAEPGLSKVKLLLNSSTSVNSGVKTRNETGSHVE